MTTATTPSTLSKEKTTAFKHRQRDTSWGYAFAHLIPFVGLYYACDRRTITPFLYSYLGSWGVGFLLGLAMVSGNPKVPEKELEAAGIIAGLVATPLLVKRGIDQARNHGKLRLLENGIELPSS